MLAIEEFNIQHLSWHECGIIETALKADLKVLGKVDHPHLLQYKGIHTNQTLIRIVSSFAAGGSLAA